MNLLLLLMISSKRIVPSVDKIIVVLWINVLSFNVSWCPHRGSDSLQGTIAVISSKRSTWVESIINWRLCKTNQDTCLKKSFEYTRFHWQSKQQFVYVHHIQKGNWLPRNTAFFQQKYNHTTHSLDTPMTNIVWCSYHQRSMKYQLQTKWWYVVSLALYT